MRSKGRPRSDASLKANNDEMRLLAAVAYGRIQRGEGYMAPHILDGESVRLQLSWLAREELVHIPMIGPARLLPRGEQLLNELAEELATDADPDT